MWKEEADRTELAARKRMDEQVPKEEGGVCVWGGGVMLQLYQGVGVEQFSLMCCLMHLHES